MQCLHPGLGDIDWQRPWLDQWREPGQRVADLLAPAAVLIVSP